PGRSRWPPPRSGLRAQDPLQSERERSPPPPGAPAGHHRPPLMDTGGGGHMIAFLGTGLLGSGFVRALRGRGEAVNVWNRTAEKAKALEAHGAKAFGDPAEAVRGAA